MATSDILGLTDLKTRGGEMYDVHHGLSAPASADAPSWARGASQGWDAAARYVSRLLDRLVSYQARVTTWAVECFGERDATDLPMRSHRFLEESLELVQACGCSKAEVLQLVDYVYGRPIGERDQEVGGVMVTLAALCAAQQLDMDAAGERELARVWENMARIRAKHASKPDFSPLPGQA
jgi:hypothetical protein